MKGIAAGASAEVTVKNSRFLAESFPVESQERARLLLKSQKEKYEDARHVVHAFVIGPTGGILGCSDDGEPSGTAGRPVLDILKGSGITGIMVTVTRWFGGTRLGTGGLVKAYGDAARAVLDTTQATELVEVRDFTLSVSYEQHDRLLREITSPGITIGGEDFDAAVTIRGTVSEGEKEAFALRVAAITNGQSKPAFAGESRLATVPPV